MKRRDFFIGSAMLAGLVQACGGRREVATVDYILVEKSRRRMTLFENGKKKKTYRIHLGNNPIGHKRFEGDGKTPEGRYRITGKNPRSSFHLSLHISYPNREDAAFAKQYNRDPGGDIFIHGGPNRAQDRNKKDWTAGCIAVTDREITEIYRWVKVGAIIDIKA